MKTILTYHLAPYLTFLFGFIISLISIPQIIKFVRKKNIMDTPNKRSSHKQPIPTLGGLSFIFSLLIFYFIFPQNILTTVLIISSVLLAITGYIDDTKGLSSKIKFIVQTTVALVLFFSDLRFSNLFGFLNIHEIGTFISLVLTVIVMVAIINAFNLVDGIDGLAGGLSFINMGVFSYIFFLNNEYYFGYTTLVLTGSILGFLIFNFNPAKIFMGDTGSLVLGLVTAIFFIKIFSYGNGIYSTVALSTILFPCLDMTRLFVSRIVKGISPFKADKNHYHHLLLKTDNKHKKASIIMYLINTVLIGCGFIFGTLFGFNSSFIILIGVGILSYVLIDIRAYKKSKISLTKNKKKLNTEIKKNQLLKNIIS